MVAHPSPAPGKHHQGVDWSTGGWNGQWDQTATVAWPIDAPPQATEAERAWLEVRPCWGYLR